MNGKDMEEKSTTHNGDFKFYEVGGKIRDEFLGLINKDVDYVAMSTHEKYMYHILKSYKLTESLNSLPTVREIHFDDVTEIRRSIGQGIYVCKLLAQKSYTNEDAIKLFHDKMKEICNG